MTFDDTIFKGLENVKLSVEIGSTELKLRRILYRAYSVVFSNKVFKWGEMGLYNYEGDAVEVIMFKEL